MAPLKEHKMCRAVLSAYLILMVTGLPCAYCCAAPLCADATTLPTAGCCAVADKSCHTCGGCCTGAPTRPRDVPTPQPCPGCPAREAMSCCGVPLGKLDESFGSSWLRLLLDAALGSDGLT